MNYTAYIVPAYLPEIMNIIKEEEWIIHTFPIEKRNEIYNPADYFAKLDDGYSYTITIDLNLYQYILNIAKKDIPQPILRKAASFLVFCQIVNIAIEPALSIDEKINYDTNISDETIKDLEIFRNIDNTNSEDLAKYALEYEDRIPLENSCQLNYNDKKNELTQRIKLNDKESLYLTVLYITDLHQNNKIKRNQKIKMLSNWMIFDFKMTLVAFSFAIILFGEKPIKKMMKYKKNKNSIINKKSIENMTWDLYFMNKFFKQWVNKKDKQEFLYASADKALRASLWLAIDLQNKRYSALNQYMKEEEFLPAIELLLNAENISNRKYNQLEYAEKYKEYRDELIQKYENKLY